MPSHFSEEIHQAAELLRGCESVLWITGAGLSADSGLPTYRGVGGLYEHENTEENLPIETLLSGRMMQTRPELCWKYILELEQACRGAGYNAGHRSLALMEKHFQRSWILTQNVDGFHHAAGSSNVLEIHGNLHSLSCLHCSFRMQVEDYSGFGQVPLCLECGQVLRPDVVLFGEMLPLLALERLDAELEQGFDAVVSIGTSSLFPYIAQPVLENARRGGVTLEINPEATLVSSACQLCLRASAAQTLQSLFEILEQSFS